MNQNVITRPTNGITREEAKKCVGKGWHTLIDTVYDFFNDDVYITQVKEKWGGLRIYADYITNLEWDFLEDIEEISLKTCEDCGNDGELVKINGWWRTLCNECKQNSN